MKSGFFLKLLRFRHKKGYGRMALKNLEYPLTNWLLSYVNTRNPMEPKIDFLDTP